MPGRLRVTQVRSTISHIARNRATMKALGLHGVGSTVEVVDNDATRGMVRQVRFLVSVEEQAEDVAAQPAPRQGDVERPSERTANVRERGGAGGNEGRGRISGDSAKGSK
jgi:large subunit ribosomal protein L30